MMTFDHLRTIKDGGAARCEGCGTSLAAHPLVDGTESHVEGYCHVCYHGHHARTVAEQYVKECT